MPPAQHHRIKRRILIPITSPQSVDEVDRLARAFSPGGGGRLRHSGRQPTLRRHYDEPLSVNK